MVHILSEIFLEYGDSIWVIPLAVFALVLVVVVISVIWNCYPEFSGRSDYIHAA